MLFRSYIDTQGQEVARRSLDFKANPTIPLYKLDVPGLGYSEGITGLQAQVQTFKVDQGKEERKAVTPDEGLVAADAGFNNLMLAQFAALKAGQAVRFSLIVPGKGQAFRFRAKKIGEATVAGEAGIKLLVEPDSMLRWLVAPIELVYDVQGTRLMRYTGVSNLLNPETREVYRKVVITYSNGPVPSEAKLPAALLTP